MKIEKIELEVIELIGDGLTEDAVSVKPETLLIEDGVLDSLRLLDLIELLEKRYSFSFSDEEMVPENFDTVRSIARLLVRKLDT